MISGISGGSLLAALYAYGPQDFTGFDHTSANLLRSGLQGALIRRALTPPAAARNLAAANRVLLPRRPGKQPRLRTANRTDALRDELAHRVFGDRVLGHVTHRDLATVITATDLRTGNAVRFGSLNSSCSAYGSITAPVTVAEAVAASAAFPLLLPAMERTYTFTWPGTAAPSQHVLLTDGGIYDNLGLSVLEPGRSANHTAHVYDVDYIIACDATRGKLRPVAGHFAGTRLRRSFDVDCPPASPGRRTEPCSTPQPPGQLQGVIHAYLGMPDERVPIPIANLVPVTAVRHYPTDFKAMTPADIQLITTRGEQLTRVLLAHYCPDLSLNP